MHQSTGELYKDTSHQGGASSSYKLTHKNGDAQYFSNTGRWLATYNRFGNCIKVVNGSGNEKMVIEDTVGRRVVFSDSVSGNTTTQTVTMPDGSKTKLAYVRNTYNNYAKTLFDKKTDAAGNVTKYEYTVNADDNYKNVLLKKITMPTGLQNCYEYGWANNIEILEGGNYQFDDYDYPRITKKYMVNDGKTSKVYTYTYDGSYIFSQVHFLSAVYVRI